MPRSILDMGDQIFVRCAVGMALIHLLTDQVNDIQIGPLVVSTNIVCVIDPAVTYDPVYGANVVINIEPVTNLPSISVDGQWFSIQPQWQTKTPTRASSSDTSFSAGYSRF